MTARSVALGAAGWQVWHVALLAVGFVALVILVRRLRRKGFKNSRAVFLKCFPDAAKLYIILKENHPAPVFRIQTINNARPCRFSDRAGRGVFVPAGRSVVVMDTDDGPMALGFEAAPYGEYKLDRSENGKPIITEIEQ